MNSPRPSDTPDSGVVLTWALVAVVATLAMASLSGKFGPEVKRATHTMFLPSVELGEK